jgi:SAM-dependent methyltransferase
MDLGKIYANRFSEGDRKAKDEIWQVLCHDFFQKYVPRTATVLDLGAGFCEFLRHIECREMIAVDLNPQVKQYAPPGTKVIIAPSHQLGECPDDSVDIVFASNFFEHLPDKETFLATLHEIRRILRPGGKLLVLQPNIRVLGGSYWDFIDHHIPLSDRTLIEAAHMADLDVTELFPRFLPYTTRGRLPQNRTLVRLYLRCPPIWQIIGGQAWMVAMKPDRATA